MKASITQSTITLTGKLTEESKMMNVFGLMANEINSLCIMEVFGAKDGAEQCEITMCYSADESTVKTVKESYSDAKKAA